MIRIVKLGTSTLVILCMGAIMPLTTWAGAASGFGLFITSASITTDDAITDQEYAEATVGGGADYQLALGENFSLGLGFEELIGDAMFPTLPQVDGHKLSSVEIEARIWVGSAFLGYHRGTFIFTTGEGFGSPEISGGKAGDGVSIGIEGDSGWFVVAQTVQVGGIQVENGPAVDAEGYRVRLGYRWR